MVKPWWKYAYLVDWIIAVTLGSIAVCLQFLHNARPELESTVITDDHTVTIFALYVITLIVPVVTIVLYQALALLWAYWVRRSVEDTGVYVLHDLHNSFLGLASGFGITAFIVEILYMIMSKVAIYDCPAHTKCPNELERVYPSLYAGYTSLGMAYLSLYISRKSRSQRTSILHTLMSVLPLLVLVLVCISQINQGRTTLVNVYFGLIIGVVVAIPCYRIYFDPEGNPRVIGAENQPRKDILEEGSTYEKHTRDTGVSVRMEGSKNSSIRSY